MSSDRQRRSERLTVRLTPDERRTVERRATDCRLQPSSYLRQAALDATPRARRVGLVLQAVHELSGIATDLDAVLRSLREENRPEVEDDLVVIRQAVGRVLRRAGSAAREASS